ncbi:hypothetical protein [Psychroflexus planctonicus]|nr:hypothetical protein [Psychroflexus planctonicus]
MKLNYSVYFFCFAFVICSYSQEAATNRNSFLERHIFSGELRNFYMNTLNLQPGLEDYQTNATALFLAYVSPKFNNFSFHVGSRYITRLDNFNLNKMDEITEKTAKWEYELYNVLDKNDFSIFTLDEFYLQFETEKLKAKVGNFYSSHTPFFNQSDGRMRPFAYRGHWLDYQISEKHKIQYAWLSHVLVRSTANWYGFSEAIGLFSQGFQPNGEVADYADFIQSNGAGFLNYTFNKKSFQLDLYQFYVDQLLGISFAEVHYTFKKWTSGVQYAYQFPLQNSRQIAYQNRYIQPDENAQVISSKLAYDHSSQLKFSAAYSYSFATGRVLFPKELGRDWFYTSIARARMEGLGDTHAILFTGNYRLENPNLKIGLEMIQMYGPKQNDFQFNKYNIDEFWQLNTRLTYQTNFLKGLEFDVLFIIKENFNSNAIDFVFNRSDFAQLSFVTKLHF